jgi:hypothetical protein
MTQEGSTRAGDPTGLAHLLTTAAAGDTLMRDLYLARARSVLEPICSETRYRAALGDRATVDRLLAQSRAAVGRQDWKQVEELAARAAQLRRGLESEQAGLAVAEEVYDARPVALDPFSRGLARFAKVDAASVRTETLGALERLARDDQEQRDLYLARKQAVAALAPVASEAQADPKAEGQSAERRALAAVERGDVAELARLAQNMREAAGRKATETAAAPGAAGRFEAPAVLSQPYPEACLAPARALGLEHIEFREQSPESAGKIRAFIEQYAWAASAATLELARDGVAELRTSLGGLPAVEHDTAEVMAETVSLFALHLFVNSAGIRYLPMLSPREFVLLETHPEGDDTPSGLVRALGLERRRTLAREDIELALIRHGGGIVSNMGLDPRAFRIVCVPPDVYMRIGAGRGWGTRQEWTHFDGYQVRQNGRLLALVGGNARYGGIADLCGISSSDARDNVVTRFAVVRRERLATGLV